MSLSNGVLKVLKMKSKDDFCFALAFTYRTRRTEATT